MEIIILCPEHNKEETLKFPSSYREGFSGQVMCGTEDKPVLLHIHTRGANVISLKLTAPYP